VELDKQMKAYFLTTTFLVSVCAEVNYGHLGVDEPFRYDGYSDANLKIRLLLNRLFSPAYAAV
jgi:hypothetical protein